VLEAVRKRRSQLGEVGERRFVYCGQEASSNADVRTFVAKNLKFLQNLGVSARIRRREEG